MTELSKVQNGALIGIEQEDGALIIDDTSRNATAETALNAMAQGLTLVEAAKELNIKGDHLRMLISRNPDYDQKYARIKICRYVDMIERLITFVDDMPDCVEREREFKLTKQFDAYKFAIGKYDVHVAKAMEQANLTLNVNAEGAQGLSITFVGDKEQEGESLRNVTRDAVDIET